MMLLGEKTWKVYRLVTLVYRCKRDSATHLHENEIFFVQNNFLMRIFLSWFFGLRKKRKTSIRTVEGTNKLFTVILMFNQRHMVICLISTQFFQLILAAVWCLYINEIVMVIFPLYECSFFSRLLHNHLHAAFICWSFKFTIYFLTFVKNDLNAPIHVQRFS